MRCSTATTKADSSASLARSGRASHPTCGGRSSRRSSRSTPGNVSSWISQAARPPTGAPASHRPSGGDNVVDADAGCPGPVRGVDGGGALAASGRLWGSGATRLSRRPDGRRVRSFRLARLSARAGSIDSQRGNLDTAQPAEQFRLLFQTAAETLLSGSQPWRTSAAVGGRRAPSHYRQATQPRERLFGVHAAA